MTPFYWFGYWVTKILYLILYHVTYEGQEKVPAAGGYLIVANHRFLKDPLLLAHGLRRQVYFMGKKEFFQNPFLRVIFTWLGVFPVDRGSGDMGAIGRGVELVRQGKLVGLFPEGTRNRAGGPMKPKSGAAFIARQTGADIIPCGLIFQEGSRGFRARITVRYGDPIPYESLGFTDEASPSSLRKASKIIMGEVNKLLGEDAPGQDAPGSDRSGRGEAHEG